MKKISFLSNILLRHCNNRIQSALFLLLFFLAALPIGAQVNAYAKVTSVTAAGTRLNLSNLHQTYHTFQAGQQIIIMQMQDNVIGSNTTDAATFGDLATISNAGMFEVATIASVTGLPGFITITSPLQNTYNTTTGSVQIVTFRNMGVNYTTAGNINAVPWNGSVGGIVAIQVSGTLTLAHAITADAQGFRGGAASAAATGTCATGTTTYISTSANFGAKGEGIYLNTTGSVTGRGKLLTGGGGGAYHNAGGGGGGNYLAGGLGGPGWECTNTTGVSGGQGGIALNTTTAPSRIFMGGGGGGGQQNNATGSAGTNGGGIVIIKANTLVTSCSGSVRISANGADVTSSGNDGAGGAGAGGTVVLEVKNYTVSSGCTLGVQGNGGNGGNVNTADAHGGGGGGGQGVIMTTGTLSSPFITATTTPGTGGFNSNVTGATQASSGSGTSNAGVLIGVGIVLPVKLFSFAAEKKNDQAILTWTTNDESDISYNMQHATDGIHFTTLATIKGKGAINGRAHYTYIHQNPAPGTNYYRLEMTGDKLLSKTEYSSITSVNLAARQNIMLAYPNPARERFTLQAPGTGNNNTAITITDLSGKTVYANTLRASNNIIEVNIGGSIKPGTYIIRVAGSREQVGKLIIQ